MKSKEAMREAVIKAFRVLTHARMLTDKQRSSISKKIQAKYLESKKQKV